MNPQTMRALGFVVKDLRPEWPKDLIEDGLTTALAARPMAVVAVDAIDAALNLNLRAPGVLATHRATTKADTSGHTASPPPPVCERCGRRKCGCTGQPAPSAAAALVQAKPEFATKRATAQTRTCPTCQAAQGQPCTDINGKPVAMIPAHKTRTK